LAAHEWDWHWGFGREIMVKCQFMNHKGHEVSRRKSFVYLSALGG